MESRERIKRNTLIGHIIDGGIGLADLYSKFKALKAASISRLLENKGNLYDFANSIRIQCNLNGMYLLKTNVRKEQYFNLVTKLPLLYREVFCSFNESKTSLPLNLLSSDEVLQQPIWNNFYFTSNEKPLIFYRWIRSNVLYVKYLYNDDGNLKCIEDFAKILVDKTNYLCLIYSVKENIFPVVKKSLIVKRGNM